MLNKSRKLVREFRTRFENISRQNDELIWAHVFHDTIKDREWLNKLSLSPGRWAADYSLLYLMVRILSDYKPKKILELGLGQSSKLISSFLDNDLKDAEHLIVEHDENWSRVFETRFSLSKNSTILNLPLVQKTVKGNEVYSYDQIEEQIQSAFDLYLVDGPFGSANLSRYDICKLATHLTKENEFIIIMDDYNREGEKETVSELLELLKSKEIQVYTGIYSGTKTQIIIVTENYRFATTM